MIGVNHCDSDGNSKLEKLLNELSPTLILVEGSISKEKAQAHYLSALKKEIILRELNPDMASILVAEQELKGFEIRTARRYCENKGLHPPSYFEDEIEARGEDEIKRIVAESTEYIAKSPEVLAARRRLDVFNQNIKALYQLASEQINSPHMVRSFPFLSLRHIGLKDTKMEEKLREVSEENPDAKIVTVTGLKHILETGTGNSFYDRIKDLNPERRFLY